MGKNDLQSEPIPSREEVKDFESGQNSEAKLVLNGGTDKDIKKETAKEENNESGKNFDKNFDEDLNEDLDEDLDEDSNEEFKEDFIQNLNSFSNGEIVEGTVVAVTQDSAFIDIGFKSEGEVQIKEFKEPPSKGDKVKVMIVNTENREGKLILSKQKADELINWENLRNAYKEKLPLEGKVIEKTKGGVNVDVLGFKAFCPLSQLDMKKIQNLDNYIGKVFLFKIDKIDGKNNIVVSHRKFLEEEKKKNIETFFDTKKPGDIVEGKVKEIVNYGAFIDLGDLDGLLHNSDISWGKVNSTKKYLNKGETVKCMILSLDRENKKVSLGLKQLVPDPWKNFTEKYEKGKKYRGTITKLTNFGAFVELEEGIEGLLHVSELSWTKRIKHPKEVLRVGDEVDVMLLDYDLSKKNISLGLKQVLPNPWDEIDVQYPINSKIKGKITRITKFGVFIEIEDGIEGLLHIDDISWTKPSKNILESFKLGQSIEVLVLDIDKENKKIRLGLKQLTENPWETLKVRHPIGSVVSGTVTSVTDFGVFMKIEKDIEGLIHISQLSNERVENPQDLYKIGDEIKAVVVDIDENKKKVTLSIREYLNHLEHKEIEKYLENDKSDTGTFSLGSIIKLNKIGE